MNLNQPIADSKMSTISKEDLQKNLKDHITYLSQKIGPRNIEDVAHHQKLYETAQYIDNAFQEIGYCTNITSYSATYNNQKFDVQNIEVAIPGSIVGSNGMDPKNSGPSECIVIGAHYDTVRVSPGADDNGSGIANRISKSYVWFISSIRR